MLLVFAIVFSVWVATRILKSGDVNRLEIEVLHLTNIILKDDARFKDALETKNEKIRAQAFVLGRYEKEHGLEWAQNILSQIEKELEENRGDID